MVFCNLCWWKKSNDLISLLKNKGEVHYAFKELHHIIKSEYRKEIQILQTDNGGENINHKMQFFVKKKTSFDNKLRVHEHLNKMG